MTSTRPAIDRRSRTPDVRAAHRADPALQLSLVLRELADLLGGLGALLTLHPSDDSTPVLLFADATLAGQQRDAMYSTINGSVGYPLQDGHAFWREDVGSDHLTMFLMPVDRLERHGRVLISVLLQTPTTTQRNNIECIYQERRPFATGFFHLWQQIRVLEQHARATDRILDHTSIGLVMLDLESRIVFANDTADEILSLNDGLGRAQGKLRAANMGDSINLQAALSHISASSSPKTASKTVSAPMLAFHRREGAPLVATVLPALPQAVEPTDVAAVVYIADPRLDAQRMLSPLCRLYGLSAVETSLVCYLASGVSLVAAAGAMRVKEQTARGYLKTIFAKTNTRGQTQLVALMLSSFIKMRGDTVQEPLPVSRGGKGLDL